MGGLVEKARGLFVSEQAWRMFVVLQLAGLLSLFVLDTTNISWSILPSNKYRFEWDLFNSLYYTRHSTNWYALAFLFGPFILAKAFDWVSSSGSYTVEPRMRKEEITLQMKASMIECTASIKEKWIAYNETMKFKDNTSLVLAIEAFAAPVQAYVQTHYPNLLAGGGKIFWMMIFTAILEAGTHPKDRINQAIEVLGERHALTR